MIKKYGYPEKIELCPLCGREVVKLHYANGFPYYTNVVLNDAGQKRIVLGEGNHYNLKPVHNCVGEAEKAMQDAQQMLEGRQEAIDKARANLNTCKSLIGQPVPQDNAWLANLHKTMIDNIPAQEKSLAELEAQTANYVRYAAEAKETWEKLSKGISIVPAGQIMVGRNVKVVKGRKVPVGTVGRVFWTGEDRFNPDNMRVGMVTAEGAKYYTSNVNVEVVQ